MPLGAEGKTVLQYLIHPLLEDGGAGVPVEGVLEEDDIVLQQQLLLMGHVDEGVGIALAEIVHRHPLHIAQCLQQRLVGMGAVIRGVGEQNQDLLHAGCWAPQANRYSAINGKQIKKVSFYYGPTLTELALLQ